MSAKIKAKANLQIDLAKLKVITDKYKGQEGSLIPILQDAQATYGYLPKEVLEGISDLTNIPLSRVYGVVTFYTQFHLKPRGRHTVKMCSGTACHVKRGQAVLDKLKEVLNVEEGETTNDLRFTLETVACLGTCFLAPVMIIENDYFGGLSPDKVENILDQYK